MTPTFFETLKTTYQKFAPDNPVLQALFSDYRVMKAVYDAMEVNWADRATPFYNDAELESCLNQAQRETSLLMLLGHLNDQHLDAIHAVVAFLGSHEMQYVLYHNSRGEIPPGKVIKQQMKWLNFTISKKLPEMSALLVSQITSQPEISTQHKEAFRQLISLMQDEQHVEHKNISSYFANIISQHSETIMFQIQLEMTLFSMHIAIMNGKPIPDDIDTNNVAYKFNRDYRGGILYLADQAITNGNLPALKTLIKTGVKDIIHPDRICRTLKKEKAEIALFLASQAHLNKALDVTLIADCALEQDMPAVVLSLMKGVKHDYTRQGKILQRTVVNTEHHQLAHQLIELLKSTQPNKEQFESAMALSVSYAIKYNTDNITWLLDHGANPAAYSADEKMPCIMVRESERLTLGLNWQLQHDRQQLEHQIPVYIQYIAKHPDELLTNQTTSHLDVLCDFCINNGLLETLTKAALECDNADALQSYLLSLTLSNAPTTSHQENDIFAQDQTLSL